MAPWRSMVETIIGGEKQPSPGWHCKTTRAEPGIIPHGAIPCGAPCGASCGALCVPPLLVGPIASPCGVTCGAACGALRVPSSPCGAHDVSLGGHLRDSKLEPAESEFRRRRFQGGTTPIPCGALGGTFLRCPLCSPLLRGPLRPLAGSLRRPLFPTPMRGPLRPLRGHLRGSLRCPCVFPHTHAGPVAPPCGAACGAPCGRQCGRSVELAAALPVAPAHQDADARQDDRERHRYDSNGATGISNFGTASFKFRSGVWSRRLQI